METTLAYFNSKDRNRRGGIMSREKQYERAIQLIREGADDEQIRREFGYNPQVINGLRQSLADKGPTW